MKDSRCIILLILIWGYPMFILPQDTLKLFIVSRLIGEKLDRIEEDYFKIFPSVTNFQQATFYSNPDGSLNVNIKGCFQNTFMDTTLRYPLSPSQLRHKLNQIVLENIKEDKIYEFELNTEDNTKFAGTLYSFDNDQIKLVKASDFNYQKEPQDDLPEVNYSDLKTITYYKSNIVVTVFMGLLGISAGAYIGAVLGPVLIPRDEGMLDLRDLAGGIIGGIVGGIFGFAGGSMIKIPVVYDAKDINSRQIIMENTLLRAEEIPGKY